MQRIALYIRVSTREQKLHGFSIAAQKDILTKYAADHPEFHVVDEYVDDGYTASNTRRPALQRLLDDVRAGKIDLIVFTKLDRWFRSVQKYYSIQSVLDENNVCWKAVQEDYETITSSGRFKVNIMLSVAQNEIDRTSERIRDVFTYKIEQGHVITGEQPYGYDVENGKPVLNPDAARIVQDIYNTFELEQSLRKTMMITNARHNLNISYNSLRKILVNERYTGIYRNIMNYYPQIITPDQFENIKYILQKNIKTNTSKENHVYIFSGLLYCSNCGNRLSGCNVTRSSKDGMKKYMYYRCNNAYKNDRCNFLLRVSERMFEERLLQKIKPALEAYTFDIEQSQKIENLAAVNVAEIKSEMDRLNMMFRKGRIEEKEYDSEYEKLEKKLLQKKKPVKILTQHKKVLQSGFNQLYNNMEPNKKRIFWRSIIEKIVFRSYDDFDIKFL